MQALLTTTNVINEATKAHIYKNITHKVMLHFWQYFNIFDWIYTELSLWGLLSVWLFLLQQITSTAPMKAIITPKEERKFGIIEIKITSSISWTIDFILINNWAISTGPWLTAVK